MTTSSSSSSSLASPVDSTSSLQPPLPSKAVQQDITVDADRIFMELQKDEANRYCVVCNARNPEWTSIGFGTFVCLTCAGRHRSFGVHVTLVRSINMDDWKQSQIIYLQMGGNSEFINHCANYINAEPANSSSERYNNGRVVYYTEILRSKIQGREPTKFEPSQWSSVCNNNVNEKRERPEWIKDADSSECMICGISFTFFIRRHHCRRCGMCICGYCAPTENTRPIREWGMVDPVRHCKKCYKSPAVNWSSIEESRPVAAASDV